MSEINRLVLEDEQGNDYVMYVKDTDDIDLLPDSNSEDEYESMGITDTVRVKLVDIHNTLKTYAFYATGAFKDIPSVDVEEMTLKFGIKVSGSTGIPFLTNSSAEADFHVEVKCKPKQHNMESASHVTESSL